MAFGVAAFFGKLNWTWLAMIMISLFILASTEAIVAYANKAGEGSPGVITYSEVEQKFNDSSNHLQLRNDAMDFDYLKKLVTGEKTAKSPAK